MAAAVEDIPVVVSHIYLDILREPAQEKKYFEQEKRPPLRGYYIVTGSILNKLQPAAPVVQLVISKPSDLGT